MPGDRSESTSPLDPFRGSYAVPGFDLEVRWLDSREVSDETRDELVALLGTCFNGNPSWAGLGVRGSDHVDWKFREYPLGSTAILTVEPDGGVIGFNGRNRRPWLVGGTPHIGSHGNDLCRLPEWQGRGLGRVLDPYRGRTWHPADDFQIGEGTHPADRHLSMERGLKPFANETHDYVRLLRPLDVVRRLGRRRRRRNASSSNARAAGPVSNTAAVIRSREGSRRDRLVRGGVQVARLLASQARRRPAPRSVPWSITTVARFEDEQAEMISRSLGQFDFVGDRPIEYLNWRFCDERGGAFTVRVAREGGEELGYAVTRAQRGSAFLADILALPGRADVAESLIRDAIELAGDAGAGAIRARLPKRHVYGGALARAGFVDVGHVAGELVEARDRNDPAFAVLEREDARIHYVFADSDWV